MWEVKLDGNKSELNGNIKNKEINESFVIASLINLKDLLQYLSEIWNIVLKFRRLLDFPRIMITIIENKSYNILE